MTSQIRAADVRLMFSEDVTRFVRHFPRVRGVRLEIVREHFLGAKRTARDLAWYDVDRHTVYLVADALHERSFGCLRGVLRHELGHAADDRVHVDKDAEVRADQLAFKATGSAIRYTSDGVQHVTHGTIGRPPWLPR